MGFDKDTMTTLGFAQWRARSSTNRWAIQTVAAGDKDVAAGRWAKAIQERQRKNRRARNTLAQAFEEAGQPGLTQKIRQFVETMPSPQTEGWTCGTPVALASTTARWNWSMTI